LFELLDVNEVVETVSVGGFVAELLGRVPRTEDEVIWNGLVFRVLRASSRRAERILVTREEGKLET
jgi:CBS domain containing-hemolysin-like protein